jgi:hypothetical protein
MDEGSTAPAGGMRLAVGTIKEHLSFTLVRAPR